MNPRQDSKVKLFVTFEICEVNDIGKRYSSIFFGGIQFGIGETIEDVHVSNSGIFPSLNVYCYKFLTEDGSKDKSRIPSGILSCTPRDLWRYILYGEGSLYVVICILLIKVTQRSSLRP